jgi:hypothetical protein
MVTNLAAMADDHPPPAATANGRGDLKSTTYELFVLAISLQIAVAALRERIAELESSARGAATA